MEHISVVEDQFSMTIDDYETTAYESDCESSRFVKSDHEFEEFTSNRLMVRLDEGKEHSAIKQSFLAGTGLLFGKEINVVAVHKNSCGSVTGQARVEAFRVFSQAVAAKRGGDANVKYGWYGGSRDEIRDIVAYGFGRCGEFVNGVSHGVGVYLSPANVPLDSVLRAREDENGVRHMLLCRVIVGNPETIPVGSDQFQPSSAHFDSGIDNPVAPTKYIIWSAYMNSHIFPNYTISFTANSSTAGSGRSCYSAKNPTSPSMKFPVLLNVLSRFLHPSKMGLILNCYKEFRENKLARSQMIRRLRNLVGDNVLISVIKLCRDKSL